MGSRESRVPGAAAVLVALVVAACGGTAVTPGSPPASPSPFASESAEPTAAPSGSFDYESAAAAIIEALGGKVPAGATAAITYGDSIAGSSSVHVALGDWQMAWDSKGVLRHVFWEQPTDEATPPSSAMLSEAQIRGRVDAFVAALDLAIGPPKDVVDQEGAWMAAWPRLVDGVPAEENGTRFWVNDDGTFLQYTFGWNDLGPKPPSLITADKAMQAVEECQGGAGPSEKCQTNLVWHLPSTAAADAPLVLCWIVAPKGGSGDWRVWVDAGTGEIADVAALLD